MIGKKQSRLRRAKKTRSRVRDLGATRFSVHRTPRHIYAVILQGDKVLVSASTLDGEVRKECTYGGNIVAAKVVGKYIAVRAKAKGITRVAFDRSGFKYHGRILALAESAREHGLEF